MNGHEYSLVTDRGVFRGISTNFYVAVIEVALRGFNDDDINAWKSLLSDAISMAWKVSPLARSKEVIRIDIDCENNVVQIIFARPDTPFFSKS